MAQGLKGRLVELGKSVIIIDGDKAREEINKGLGFDSESVLVSNKRVANLAKAKLNELDFVLVSIISPYTEARRLVRKILKESFVEVFVNCPLGECVKRDTKGLYAKAQKGEISNLLGFNDGYPYEIPENPDLEIKTNELSLEQSLEKIMKFLCL